MEEAKKKGKGGRPKTGKLFPHKVFGYLTEEEFRLLGLLAAQANGSGKPLGLAGAIRKAIREQAKREGVK